MQFSVFEITVAPDQWVMVRARLLAEMDTACDSLRRYFLGSEAAAGSSMSAQRPRWISTDR